MPSKPFMAKFDQGDGSVHFHKCVRFSNGQVWTEDKYLRLLKQQEFRRAVINRHYGLVKSEPGE